MEGGTEEGMKGERRDRITSTMAINSYSHKSTPLSLPRRRLIGSSLPDNKTTKHIVILKFDWSKVM